MKRHLTIDNKLMAAKESFGLAYEAATPRPYYRSYEATRLSIVEYASRLVRTLLLNDLAQGPIIDLGCGYGALGVLLRTRMSIAQVFQAYLEGNDVQLQPPGPAEPKIIGIDRSRAALRSACTSNAIDVGVMADLNDSEVILNESMNSAIAVCTAVLGYVRPSALRLTIETLEPQLSVVTCVTWLCEELETVFEVSSFELTRLTDVPVFQRWATEGEEKRMPGALIDGAHRAHCFLLHRDQIPEALLRREIESLRVQRQESRWLAAGHSGGCELIAT